VLKTGTHIGARVLNKLPMLPDQFLHFEHGYEILIAEFVLRAIRLWCCILPSLNVHLPRIPFAEGGKEGAE
jgi:hypothetical protein